MARKVFISMLGAGFYGECQYVDDKKSFNSTSTRFVQAATLEYIDAKKWTPADQVIIALTDGARKDNWDVKDGKRENKRDKKIEDYEGLHSIVDKMHLSCQVKDLRIPDGQSEDEMWEIFTSLYNELNEGDELYLDLTHGFRYLPMLLLVLCDYAKFLKHIEVKHISYGNFEAQKDQRAPFVNLLPLVQLQDWTFAAADYLENGNTDHLSELGQGEDFIEALEDLAKDRQTCRGLNIWERTAIQRLLNADNPVNEDMRGKLFEELFNKIRKEEEEINQQSNPCLAAAQWCCSKRLYQQAITLMLEGIFSDVCRANNISMEEIDKREDLASALNIKHTKRPEELWDVNDKDFVRELLQKETFNNHPLYELYKEIQASGIRNDFNHAGFRASRKSAQDIIAEVEKVSRRSCSHNSIPPQPKPRLFVNFTNHPSSEWKENQIRAAEKIGEIKDESFPDVRPDLGRKK